MIQGISPAISAVKNLGKRIGNVANNVANVATAGYKKSRSTATPLPGYHVSTASGTSSVGMGSALGDISQVFQQGSFEPSDSSTSMAIGGNGFFIVRDGEGKSYYTREGNFSFNQNGSLVNSQGFIVQGRRMDPTGSPQGSLGDISIDGYNAGELEAIAVSPDGVITGSYTNGNPVDLFQVATADFQNPNGLEQLGNNLFAATGDSGSAITGSPGSGGLGRIVPHALEMSNVDLVEEFTMLILFKRSFQANLKVIEVENGLKGDVLDIIS
ncbi:MAG: flagellar hook basal-body protein [Pseudomonadota bacterium]